MNSIITNETARSGINISCGFDICNGLCIDYSKKSINGTTIDNNSICYPGQVATWCYGTESLAMLIVCVSLIFLIPTILSLFYYCFRKQQILKNGKSQGIFNYAIYSIITNIISGIFASSIICYINLKNITKTFFIASLTLWLLVFLYGLYIRFPFCKRGKAPYFTNYIFQRKVVTLSEFQEYIIDSRTSPPYFHIIQERKIAKLCPKEICLLEYNSWQEEGTIIILPTNVPIIAIISYENKLSDELEDEFRNKYPKTNTTNYKIKTDINRLDKEMIMTFNDINNSFFFKLLNNKIMVLIYIISNFFSYSFFLDLLYLANVRYINVKCVKSADLNNVLRAKNGEKDLQALTCIQDSNYQQETPYTISSNVNTEVLEQLNNFNI